MWDEQNEPRRGPGGLRKKREDRIKRDIEERKRGGMPGEGPVQEPSVSASRRLPSGPGLKCRTESQQCVGGVGVARLPRRSTSQGTIKILTGWRNSRRTFHSLLAGVRHQSAPSPSKRPGIFISDTAVAMERGWGEGGGAAPEAMGLRAMCARRSHGDIKRADTSLKTNKAVCKTCVLNEETFLPCGVAHHPGGELFCSGSARFCP